MADPPERHPFLSVAWIDAVSRIRDAYADRLPAPAVVVRANVVVTGVPFGEGQVRGCIDTSQGLAIEPGHLEEPEFTAELDYDTARALFVEQDPRAFMEAVFSGRVRLSGDASKLLDMTMAPPPGEGSEQEAAREVAAQVRAVTI